MYLLNWITFYSSAFKPMPRPLHSTEPEKGITSRPEKHRDLLHLLFSERQETEHERRRDWSDEPLYKLSNVQTCWTSSYKALLCIHFGLSGMVDVSNNPYLLQVLHTSVSLGVSDSWPRPQMWHVGAGFCCCWQQSHRLLDIHWPGVRAPHCAHVRQFCKHKTHTHALLTD